MKTKSEHKPKSPAPERDVHSANEKQVRTVAAGTQSHSKSSKRDK
jgi:hypothetical protein